MNPENTPTQVISDPKTSASSVTPIPTWKSVLKEILIFLIIAVCIVLPFRAYVAEPYIVSGTSMDPTFATGDYLIVNKLSYELGNPERNTVVIFTLRLPNQPTRDLIKRIIGLPGDTVVMNGTGVTITNTAHPHGFILDQSYLTHTMPASFNVTLGQNEYFVMGDNRPASYDSRSWGVLHRKDIIGQPFLRLLPVAEIGTLPGNDKILSKDK